jgi:hypothetical protein
VGSKTLYPRALMKGMTKAFFVASSVCMGSSYLGICADNSRILSMKSMLFSSLGCED